MDLPFRTHTTTGTRLPARTGAAAPPRVKREWDAGVPSLSEAREAVGGLLARVRPVPARRVVQDAQLVVSELVTNAFKHAAGPFALLLELSPDGSTLRIGVTDGSPDPPRPQPPDPGRIGGHGLRLVTLLCAALEVTPLHGGKQVTATLPLTTPPKR
ncbi:ATP-binding protein [Streptomyces sp. NPDC003688]